MCCKLRVLRGLRSVILTCCNTDADIGTEMGRDTYTDRDRDSTDSDREIQTKTTEFHSLEKHRTVRYTRDEDSAKDKCIMCVR